MASYCRMINEPSNHRIFIEMPLGMPDLSSTKIDNEQPRIKYPAQSAYDCWFRGIEMICFNYGKVAEQDQNARNQLEQFRKIQNVAFQGLENIRNSIKQLTEPVEVYLQIAENQTKSGKNLPPEWAGQVETWKEYAEKKKQNGPQYSADNFAWEKFIEFNPAQLFLRNSQVSIDDEYAQYVKIRPILKVLKQDSLSCLSKRDQYNMLHRIAEHSIHKKIGLTQSPWNPTCSFQQFIQQIAQQGSLLFSGSFCRAFYVDEPFQLKDAFFKRQVWAWSPDAKTRQHTQIGADHVIIVVGAWAKKEKTGTKELVYYKDVSDETDPEHPEKERLYVMSYDRLKKNAANLWNESDVIIQGDYSVVNYAVYNPRIELKQI